ncbi:hypothetical protein CDAR_262721 [Caerostris darwini]|uniref:Uncharacterized protein n=1 Tax=Caerostris darwini TaxID=1538125 RepID=A0AAV4T7E6_9ARAC|nr:hypothetical protein CDAR_262721 [Caerostris darwini]
MVEVNIISPSLKFEQGGLSESLERSSRESRVKTLVSMAFHATWTLPPAVHNSLFPPHFPEEILSSEDIAKHKVMSSVNTGRVMGHYPDVKCIIHMD